MAFPLPQEWLDNVCAVLRSNDDWRIRSTNDFTGRQLRDFPGSTRDEVVDAFLDYLEKPNPTGCPQNLPYPPGTTWEFFFPFRGYKTYGKILLRTSRKEILLLSAHFPSRPRLYCD